MTIGDDGTIDLRNQENDGPEFRIGAVDSADADKIAEGILGKVEVAPLSELEESADRPFDKVKVKFDKFVNLIASHAYEDVLSKHVDDDVIISTDLLTDLANAHEEKEDRKMPLIFIFGIVLGVGITWLLLK